MSSVMRLDSNLIICSDPFVCGLNHKIKSKSIIDPGLVRAET